MAGVYTDNQPDFSYLPPGETKTFSQYWYPIRKCGVPLAANQDEAIRLDAADGEAHIAACVTRELKDETVRLRYGGNVLAEWKRDLTVDTRFNVTVPLPVDCDESQLTLELSSGTGQPLTCTLAVRPDKPAPSTAIEPDFPESVARAYELFLTGLHLQQYRHATLSPEPYWREAIKRDQGDVRSNHALAKMHLNRGEYALAESHIRTAIARANKLNGNPYNGEIFFTPGLVLRRLGRYDEAYSAFHKATWNLAWRAAGYHAVAGNDVMRGDLLQAVEYLQLSLRTNADNLNARNLCATLLRGTGREDAAIDIVASTSDLDPLELWSRYLKGADLPNSARQQRLAELLGQSTLVDSRDDLTVEQAALFNQLHRPQEALRVLLLRQFQPWEGGEGLVLTQFTTAQIGLVQVAYVGIGPRRLLATSRLP